MGTLLEVLDTFWGQGYPDLVNLFRTFIRTQLLRWLQCVRHCFFASFPWQTNTKKKIKKTYFSSIQKHHHHITVEIKQTQDALFDTLSWAWRLEVGVAGLFGSFSENRKEVEFDVTLSYKRVRFNGLLTQPKCKFLMVRNFFFFFNDLNIKGLH